MDAWDRMDAADAASQSMICRRVSGVPMGPEVHSGEKPSGTGYAHMFVVLLALHLRQLHEEMLVRAFWQLCLDVCLAATQDDGPHTLAQFQQVLVARGAALVVELVELPVEAKQGPEDRWIEEVDDGVELVDAILDGGACQDEGVAAVQALHGPRRQGTPVLDALGLVEHNDVGPQVRAASGLQRLRTLSLRPRVQRLGTAARHHRTACEAAPGAGRCTPAPTMCRSHAPA